MLTATVPHLMWIPSYLNCTVLGKNLRYLRLIKGQILYDFKIFYLSTASSAINFSMQWIFLLSNVIMIDDDLYNDWHNLVFIADEKH